MESQMQRLVMVCLNLLIILALTACGNLPQVSAEDRLYLDISLDFLGEYDLPQQTFEQTRVGGLSGLTYDRQRDRFYAISDDRHQPRFYTLKLDIDQNQPDKIQIQKVTVEKVTPLKNDLGEIYPDNTVDAEGIALTPRGTLFIASEGSINQNVMPFIGEFDLNQGQLQQYLSLPNRFFPNPPAQADRPSQGIQNNLGFESLAVSATSVLKDDPFRLFTAIENSLIQDIDLQKLPKSEPLRFLHYVINPIGDPVLISENLYLLNPVPSGTLFRGLSDITTLEKEGYFLSLERNFTLAGFDGKLFQVVNANASDTSRMTSFKTGMNDVEPLRKELLLDLETLAIELDNLEGLALGPRLADGSQTLLLVSDDNFRPDQVTQFLLFRLNIS
jgi:hypothetical protein